MLGLPPRTGGPPGGTVRIAAVRNQGGYVITFSDSGAGVDRQTLDRVYEPFFTTKSDGTGLGLAITRKIIEGHGGTIAIESEPGKGTTVSVHLPL